MGSILLLMAGSVGMVFSIQAKFGERKTKEMALRLVLADFPLVVIFHPNMNLVLMAIAPFGLFAGYRLLRHRKKRA